MGGEERSSGQIPGFPEAQLARPLMAGRPPGEGEKVSGTGVPADLGDGENTRLRQMLTTWGQEKGAGA